MKCNIGKLDRTLRIVLGLLILALGYKYGSYWGLIGLIPLLTAVIGWCPCYLPLGISTEGVGCGCSCSCDAPKVEGESEE